LTSEGINIVINYLQVLILKFDYSFYIDILLFIFVSQVDYKVVITVDLKEFSTGQLLITMFGFMEIKLFHTQNITIPIPINSVTIPQKFIFHLLRYLSSF
jgi:hypothetical protein